VSGDPSAQDGGVLYVKNRDEAVKRRTEVWEFETMEMTKEKGGAG